MTRCSRISIVAVAIFAAAALASLSATPAAAVDPSTDLKTRIAKQANGDYGNLVHANLSAGESKNFYLRVKSVVGSKVVAVMNPENKAGLSFKYFTIAGKNITAPVTGFNYDFTVKPGKARKFRIKIAASADDIDACAIFTLDDPSGYSQGIVALNQVVCAI